MAVLETELEHYPVEHVPPPSPNSLFCTHRHQPLKYACLFPSRAMHYFPDKLKIRPITNDL